MHFTRKNTMTKAEMKSLAKLVAVEIYNLMQQEQEEFIGIEDICRIAHCSPSAVYHRKENGMPVVRSGKKLVAKRSEINQWIESRT